jgi:hypothetical protein
VAGLPKKPHPRGCGGGADLIDVDALPLLCHGRTRRSLRSETTSLFASIERKRSLMWTRMATFLLFGSDAFATPNQNLWFFLADLNKHNPSYGRGGFLLLHLNPTPEATAILHLLHRWF